MTLEAAAKVPLEARSPYEMRVIGAYLGIYLRQLEKVLANNDLGEPRMIHIEKKAMHIYVVPLQDGYHLALVQRHPALVGDLRQLEHGHAPHPGVLVRAARGDIVEIGIERVEQGHRRLTGAGTEC